MPVQPLTMDPREAQNQPRPEDGLDPDEGERAGALAWINRHKVPLIASSAAVSLLVHVIVLAIAALIQMNQPPAQIGGAATEVDFAVMTDAELSEIAAEELALEAPDADSASSPLELQAELDLGALEVDMSDLAESMGDVTLQIGGGDLDGAGLGVGESAGSGASFFGVEARGNRFAFVVDTSGSMVNDGRLQSLQQELIRSITALFSSSNFFVAFFNSAAAPLGNRGIVWSTRPIAANPGHGRTSWRRGPRGRPGRPRASSWSRSSSRCPTRSTS